MQSSRCTKENGAKKVVAYATHAVLSGNAIDNIKNSQLDELVVTNSIPLNEEAQSAERFALQLGKLLGESAPHQQRRIYQCDV